MIRARWILPHGAVPAWTRVVVHNCAKKQRNVA
jgi:hypothetical protein